LSGSEEIEDSYEASDIYENQDQLLQKGLTLPKTGSANIDKTELKRQLARSNMEMAHNVKQGTYPVFGYPLVCFSPKLEQNA